MGIAFLFLIGPEMITPSAITPTTGLECEVGPDNLFGSLLFRYIIAQVPESLSKYN
jgi:hypothetical protein